MIDIAILAVIIVVLNLAWWPAQRVLFGSSTVSTNAIDYTGSRANEMYEMRNGEVVYIRSQGIVEWLIDKNIKYPMLLIWLYFAIFWKVKHASPGQIASGTAVIQGDGSEKMAMTLALKRSFLLLLSTFIIFGVLMVLFGEKQTLYDKLCDTRVVA